MRIYIKGKSKYLSQTETRYAIRFYLNKLLPPDIYERFIIKLEFKSMKERGTCDIEFEDDYPPEDFLLEICRNSSKRMQLLTLAHELVHVKQFAKGELKIIDAYDFLWKRKRLSRLNIDYWFLPQEIEAAGYEKGLYEHYMMHKKKERITFL